MWARSSLSILFTHAFYWLHYISSYSYSQNTSTSTPSTNNFFKEKNKTPWDRAHPHSSLTLDWFRVFSLPRGTPENRGLLSSCLSLILQHRNSWFLPLILMNVSDRGFQCLQDHLPHWYCTAPFTGLLTWIVLPFGNCPQLHFLPLIQTFVAGDHINISFLGFIPWNISIILMVLTTF